MNIVTDKKTPAEAGLSGVLAHPAGSFPEAGVIILGGSEGGLHERDAVELASEGFAVLALAYFGAEGVSPILKDIPLEYFSRGIDFHNKQGANRVGMLGGSRGGEAALLVASRDSRVAAVVSIVGSGVVTPGIDDSQGTLDRILATPADAWTADGKPLQALPYRPSNDLGAIVAASGTVVLRNQYAPLPHDEHELDQISIPVERSRAAILMIAAEQDEMWDSPAYHAVATNRLTAANYQYPWESVVLPGAGHGIAGSHGKPITSTMSPGPGVIFEMGGQSARNSDARVEAWTMTVEFLKGHLV